MEEKVTILEGLLERHPDVAEHLAILLDDHRRSVSGEGSDPEVSLGEIVDAGVAVGDYFDQGC